MLGRAVINAGPLVTLSLALVPLSHVRLGLRVLTLLSITRLKVAVLVAPLLGRV